MPDNSQHRSHALRRGRVSLPGQHYHITAATRERLPFFTELSTARIVINLMQEIQHREEAHTLCYVLMPDHLHWLMSLSEKRDLSQVVRSLKALSSKRAGIPLWQRGFHDHAIRKDEDLKQIARYIVANPIRAGLVEKPGDYPHWDATWL